MAAFIQDFLGQDDALPSSFREEISAEGEKILVYALSDLDSRRRFRRAWAVVTEKRLVLFDSAERPASLPLSEIDKFDVRDGLGMSCMAVLRADGSPFAELRYTRRQAKAMGNLRFAAEQEMKRIKAENAPDLASGDIDSDAEYRHAMESGYEEGAAILTAKKANVLARLLSYLLPHRLAVTVSGAASLLLIGVSLLPPLISRFLIDTVFSPVSGGAGKAAMGLLAAAVLMQGGTLVFTETLQFLRMRFISVAGEKVAMRLRKDVYAHMQTLQLQYFTSRPTGSLIARVSSDTDRLWDFITFGFMDTAIAVLQVIGVAIALLTQDWRLAAIVLLPVPVLGFLFYLHGKRMHGRFNRVWQRWSAMTAVLSDVIPGMRVVKAFAQEEKEKDRFDRKNRAVLDEAVRIHKEWTAFWPVAVMLIHASTIMVWALGGPRVLRHIASGGAEGMPLGVFIAFTGYMWMFWQPVQQLGMMSRTINRVTTSAARGFEVLDTKPTVLTRPNARRVERIEGRVVFDDVSFSYDGIRNVLKGVSFEVKPGEMIGLVGPSGGGKTTMVNLICRFYDVKAGAIMLDGSDVRDLEVSSLRRGIGVVLQEPYLFHGTIAENIAYGSDRRDPRRIIDAARAANAHDFIVGLPDGYETVIGERGQTLSGGERQRVSIARAILHEPSLLILDEATSSVDTETEKRIQEALRRLTAGRTTFAIAHRLSTLSAANRLFVMEEGRLVEHGTHAELLAKEDGVYAKLHKTQMEMQASIAV